MKRFLLLFVILLPSCLTFSKKYNTLVEESKKHQSVVDSMAGSYNSLKVEYDTLALRVVEMTRDTLQVYNRYKRLEREHKRALEQGSSQVASGQRQLREREALYMEKIQMLDQIETYINTREYALNGIQARCEEAMRRYYGAGVVVDRRDGAITIFIPDGLLFDSTEYKLSSSGMEFVQDFSRMLSMQRNINVIVGGHAPADIEVVDSNFGDEWDLSAWRAVDITRQIINQKAINPKRIYAAGHGPWGIKADESGTKSSKCEIIIMPMLDDIDDLIYKTIKR